MAGILDYLKFAQANRQRSEAENAVSDLLELRSLAGAPAPSGGDFRPSAFPLPGGVPEGMAPKFGAADGADLAVNLQRLGVDPKAFADFERSNAVTALAGDAENDLTTGQRGNLLNGLVSGDRFKLAGGVAFDGSTGAISDESSAVRGLGAQRFADARDQQLRNKQLQGVYEQFAGMPAVVADVANSKGVTGATSADVVVDGVRKRANVVVGLDGQLRYEAIDAPGALVTSKAGTKGAPKPVDFMKLVTERAEDLRKADADSSAGRRSRRGEAVPTAADYREQASEEVLADLAAADELRAANDYRLALVEAAKNPGSLVARVERGAMTFEQGSMAISELLQAKSISRLVARDMLIKMNPSLGEYSDEPN